MTKPLRFTKAELANAAKVAKAEGVSIELKPDGGMLVIPSPAGNSGLDSDSANHGSILQQWRAAKDAGKAFGRTHR